MENSDNVINLGTGRTNSNQSDLDKVAKAIDNPEIPAHMLSQMLDNEFQAITDTIELPSKGVFYPNKQSQIKIKHLTAEDENILTSPDLIRSGKVLDVLLDNAIVVENNSPDGGLSAEDMLVGDRNAVLLYLRREGYGNEYAVKMNCPSCAAEFRENVLLSELNNKTLETMPDDSGLFSVMLPKTKWVVKFRLLNGRDEAFLAKKAEVPKKTKKNVSYSQLLTERYVLQIMFINGDSDKLKIKKAASNMPIGDSLFLREYIRTVEPGVDMNYNFSCSACGHQFEETVPINANLFWPNAKI
jgi:hypothetical protein